MRRFKFFLKASIVFLGIHIVLGLTNILRCEYALAEEARLEKVYGENVNKHFRFEEKCSIPGYGVYWETVEVIDRERVINNSHRRSNSADNKETIDYEESQSQ